MQQGDAVTVHYTGKSVAGEVFDTSKDFAPVQFVVGEGETRIPGLHTAVMGLSVGDKKTVRISAENSFVKDDELVFRVSASSAPGFKVGDEVQLNTGKKARIAEVNSKEVVVDANHPLVGQPIDVEVEILEHTAAADVQTATFGLGCFWGPELAFQRVPGVVATAVGYCNGNAKKVAKPSYEDVCSGVTGYAEVVQLKYNPKVVSYDALLELFWGKHDPTQKDRQGNDVGTQYRSGIYTHNDAQAAAAAASMAAKAASLKKTIATEIAPTANYTRAEEYHQQYLSKGGRNGNAQNPSKMCNDPIRCYG